jgi:hypothetical protein
MMAAPNSWSKLTAGMILASGDTGDDAVEELPGELVANCNEALSSATPPPGKITATPPLSLANLFCNLDLSKSEVVGSEMIDLICSQRA